MVKVIVNNQVDTHSDIVDENMTIAKVLEDFGTKFGMDCTNGMISVNGSSFQREVLDSTTLASLPIKGETYYIMCVAKTNNA